MTSTIAAAYRRQQFLPDWRGLFVNPFFIARRNLFTAVRAAAPQLRGRLLDVGCGTKPYRALFTVDEYVGLDIDSELSRARGAADVRYEGGTFPMRDAVFDSVLCSQVLEHVFRPDSFLREIARVLKPGGKLLLTVPFVWDEHEQPGDCARYTRYGLYHLLKRNGFEVREHHKLGADASIILQLVNAYIYKISLAWPLILRMALMGSVMTLVNVVGLLAARCLPSNGDLYLDHIVVAERRA